MSEKTASDTLIETLLEWQVDTIFGLPGDGINGLMEALRTHAEQIRFIQVRHEEAAAFAACGYSKLSGKLGVCLATSGPGAIHLLNGLYDAKMDGVPVLALTGQQYSDLLGTSYQQEVDLLSLFKDVAAFNQQVQGSTDVRNLVNVACRTALTKRTVAHITFPIDYQVAEASNEHLSRPGGPAMTAGDVVSSTTGFYAKEGTRSSGLPVGRPVPGQATLNEAASVLNAGKKVVILAGHGALGARAELEQLADTLGAGIVKALLGKGTVPDDSPFSMGGLGLLGEKPGQEAMERCDTILIVGSSFPYPKYLPNADKATGVQIDIDETRIGLRFPVKVGLVGDGKATLQALIPLLKRNEDRSFLESLTEIKQKWVEQLEAEGSRDDVPMKPQVVARALSDLAAPNAIITGDSGTNTTWIARNFRLRADQMFSCSGNLATMAPGLPYAIGAQTAFPDRQVIAFVGDGGFTMLMGEMLTAVKHDLPIKVVIIKNNVLGQIKWEQVVFLGNPEYGVELQTADFAAWARAAGAQGYCVEDPKDIDRVMREFLAYDGPAVLEAVVDPNEPPMPPKIEPKQARMFAEALIKGQPDGPRIALTIFRDKVEELLG
jgi:pyruvate dehydrogenase (quinone)